VLLRLAYLGVTNAFVLLRLLRMGDHDKDVEILALRHQITVLQRQLGPDKPRFEPVPCSEAAGHGAPRALGHAARRYSLTTRRVDYPAEHASSADRRAEVDHYARLVHWRPLIEALVRPVFVEVART
jgi:hypothetical protein